MDRIMDFNRNIQEEKQNYMNLFRQYEDLQRKFEYSEQEKYRLNEEVELLSRRCEMSQSQDFGNSENDSNKVLVSRLNAKISQLKSNEDKLIQENANIEC